MSQNVRETHSDIAHFYLSRAIFQINIIFLNYDRQIKIMKNSLKLYKKNVHRTTIEPPSQSKTYCVNQCISSVTYFAIIFKKQEGPKGPGSLT